MKVDQPDEIAKTVLTNMDQTAKRIELFNEMDQNPKDEKLSIEEVQLFFARRPEIRQTFFLMESNDDKLHDIKKDERSTFSLMRYDKNGDHVVHLWEYLIDDNTLKKVIIDQLKKYLGKKSILEWS